MTRKVFFVSGFENCVLNLLPVNFWRSCPSSWQFSAGWPSNWDSEASAAVLQGGRQQTQSLQGKNIQQIFIFASILLLNHAWVIWYFWKKVFAYIGSVLNFQMLKTKSEQWLNYLFLKQIFLFKLSDFDNELNNKNSLFPNNTLPRPVTHFQGFLVLILSSVLDWVVLISFNNLFGLANLLFLTLKFLIVSPLHVRSLMLYKLWTN